ncbi:hypothetical protein ACVCIH_28330 [Burkholderia glumae]|uniref:hypothetical protein n=1 Tax=Burkholderia glumae TaxID=337 RepID=UPI002036A277|nr:hypothetical protein [Burkholderia glumae]MCM2495814.1 hypothetical protein [Burkholderia glumae]
MPTRNHLSIAKMRFVAIRAARTIRIDRFEPPAQHDLLRARGAPPAGREPRAASREPRRPVPAGAARETLARREVGATPSAGARPARGRPRSRGAGGRFGRHGMAPAGGFARQVHQTGLSHFRATRRRGRRL